MRKKLITIIFLLIGLSLLTLGIIEGQLELINPYYKIMEGFE